MTDLVSLSSEQGPVNVELAVLEGGGTIASVFGRTGAIVAQSGDYSLAQIGGSSAVQVLMHSPPRPLQEVLSSMVPFALPKSLPLKLKPSCGGASIRLPLHNPQSLSNRNRRKETWLLSTSAAVKSAL